MKLFDFFRKEQKIDFTHENIEKLTKLTIELGDTLIRSNLGIYVDYLSGIRLAAEQHDTETFKKKVISRGLFGGAGALWEIWIEDNQLRRTFNEQFCEFVDLLKTMGIRNGRINQLRKSFKHFD